MRMVNQGSSFSFEISAWYDPSYEAPTVLEEKPRLENGLVIRA